MTKAKTASAAAVLLAAGISLAACSSTGSAPGSIDKPTGTPSATQTATPSPTPTQELISDDAVAEEAAASVAFIDACMDRLSVDRAILETDAAKCWYSMTSWLPQLAGLAYPSGNVTLGDPVTDDAPDATDRLWRVDVLDENGAVTGTISYWWVPDLGVKVDTVETTRTGDALPGFEDRMREAAQTLYK